jgi:hypothetical protein
MQKSVDKQKECESTLAHPVERSLLSGFGKADDDFPMSFAKGVGQDVRDIRSPSQLFV